MGRDLTERYSGLKNEGCEVFVKSSHPDARLHGYVGKIVAVNGPHCTVEFLVKIKNEIKQVTLPLRDVGVCPS